jgi:hypothetical protein
MIFHYFENSNYPGEFCLFSYSPLNGETIEFIPKLSFEELSQIVGGG